MSIFDESLSPTSLGAQLLARIARERRDGMLIWEADGQQRKIFFKGGRPELVIDAAGAESKEKPAVVTVVRTLAVAAGGRCVMWPLDREVAASLGIDTLGEALVAVARSIRPEDLASVIAARRDDRVEAAPAFVKLMPVVARLVGESIVAPSASRSFGALIEGTSPAQQRGYLALLVLGGFTVSAAPKAPEPTAAAPQPGEVPTPGPPSGRQLPLPADPETCKIVVELQRTYDKLIDASHYAVLEIEETATAEQIREAYFKQAKAWHSDRFAGKELGEEAMAMVEELFRRAGEAQKVLTDPEQRKTYDFVRERKAKGLPTDVNVIMEAESLFQKGQLLVRRGQAAGAEPLLRKSVELNKGEAEFWAYFGFAVHAAKGKEGLTEAREALKHALEMNPKLDVAHEFLGRIARIEGQLPEAQRELKQALQMNSKNRDAERELRFISMKGAKGSEDEKKGLSGLLGGFLKKK